jgi:hypothetical protein
MPLVAFFYAVGGVFSPPTFPKEQKALTKSRINLNADHSQNRRLSIYHFP